MVFLVWLMLLVYRVMAGDVCPQWTVPQVSHPHGGLQGVVCVQVVICIRGLTSDPTITSDADQSGADGAPLCLSQGNGAEVKGQNVGSDGHRFGLVELREVYRVGIGSACQECTVCELTQGGARDEQAEHITTTAEVTAHRTAVPFHNGDTIQGKQGDPVAGSGRALDFNCHDSVVVVRW